MTDSKEQDYRDEAARLAQAPREDQETMIAWLKEIAANPKVAKADREIADERAKALERLLIHGKKSEKNNKHKP